VPLLQPTSVGGKFTFGEKESLLLLEVVRPSRKTDNPINVKRQNKIGANFYLNSITVCDIFLTLFQQKIE
jgi:hypothetical protein